MPPEGGIWESVVSRRVVDLAARKFEGEAGDVILDVGRLSVTLGVDNHYPRTSGRTRTEQSIRICLRKNYGASTIGLLLGVRELRRVGDWIADALTDVDILAELTGEEVRIGDVRGAIPKLIDHLE